MGIEQTIRQWRLIQLLHGRKRGLSVQKLMEELGTSHATLYRDIRALLEAGVPLHSETRTGEAWYSFEGASLVPLNPTSLQMAALTLGRTFLAALEGTQLVAEYDALLGRWTQTPPAALPIETPPPPVRSLKPLLATIEQALQKQRRLRIVYEGARGERGERIVDPVGLKIEQTIQLYFNAYDVEKNALKTYKPIRMQEAELLPDAAAPHPELDDEDPFAHSMKVWSAPPAPVVAPSMAG